jgi:hypothetical protein
METSHARKNPDKLSGPEKVRFLSVLGKDPELQQAVVERLHEIGALNADPQGAGELLRSGADHLAHGARDAAQQLAHSPAAKRIAGRAQALASEARQRVRR